MEDYRIYGLVAFVIGGLAGYQGVYEKYRRDSTKALTTLPGLFYLLTRAAFQQKSMLH